MPVAVSSPNLGGPACDVYGTCFGSVCIATTGTGILADIAVGRSRSDIL